MSKIISRSEWGARYGRGSAGAKNRDHAIVHTTVTGITSPGASVSYESSIMRGMENYHVKNRGFNGIAYSFCIFDSGRIYEARGWGRNGAHTQSGGNRTGYGIAFVGDGTKQAPTEAAWEALRWLIGTGIEGGYFPRNYKVSGHRDWYRYKSCPGDYIYNDLQRRTAGIDGTETRPSDWVVGPGDYNDTVGIWQQQLVDMFGSSMSVDNDFGPITEGETRKFEKAYGLTVDGYASKSDTEKMAELYEQAAEAEETEPEPEEPEAPETDDKPVMPRDYKEAVRYSDSTPDERIARALASALHLHVSNVNDKSTADKVYLVGGPAVASYDRNLADEVVEVAGQTRQETLDLAADIISEYIKGL